VNEARVEDDQQGERTKKDKQEVEDVLVRDVVDIVVLEVGRYGNRAIDLLVVV